MLYLNKFNIYEEDLDSNEEETFYDILGLPLDASTEEIKDRGHKLLKEYHPDKRKDEYNANMADMFYKIYEAYETLSDEKRRKAYNESAALITVKREIIPLDDEDLETDRQRQAIVKRVKKVAEEFKVQELSFNTFYDF